MQPCDMPGATLRFYVRERDIIIASADSDAMLTPVVTLRDMPWFIFRAPR